MLMLRLRLLRRHIDHSEGLAEAAAMISEARAAAAGGSGGSSKAVAAPVAAAAAAAAGEERPPAVVDVHPKRPHRRGLQLPGDVIIPLNEACCRGRWRT